MSIRGQEGAVLRIQASPTTDYSVALDVALHFKFATNSRLENIDIEPSSAIGGVAVLLENAGGTMVKNCHINGFQSSILVEKSPGVKLFDNTIAASTAWQVGSIPDAYGIIIVNGPGGNIKGNDVSGALFGIWPCDHGGTYENNYTHHNYLGLILCKVPANSFKLPSGETTGANFSSNHWTVTNNLSTDNFMVGYLVIDGAYNNKLTNNDASGNGTYDIELTGDSYRFGFLTPSATTTWSMRAATKASASRTVGWTISCMAGCGWIRRWMRVIEKKGGFRKPSGFRNLFSFLSLCKQHMEPFVNGLFLMKFQNSIA
ncbi:MAG: right-handed parallel beta-helix repeat-containing protein [Saprospiraceae bacterium]|nr:right-handed parallel beta-helix repeat-containing protein [Saprospiraceae bacterium]